MKAFGLLYKMALTIAFSILPAPLWLAQHAHPGTQESALIKVETDLVLLNVSVKDPSGRAIAGLNKENFKVYENGIEQTVSFFRSETSAVSWGLILDRSGSMMRMIDDVYRAAVHVIDEGSPEDEAFIVTFNEGVDLVSDFIADKRMLENSVLGMRAEGRTALWDAVNFGLKQIVRGKHRKKVLVVVSDGDDNSSGIRFRDLLGRAEKEEILIYTVGMFEPNGFWAQPRGNRFPKEELGRLAEATGAHAHFPTNIQECREAMKHIALDVSHQYSIGYYPNNPVRDGQWRKIEVVAKREVPKTDYVVQTRAGYFAPRNEESK